ncbi:hypothetical protein BAS10_02620 [Elizabethkingia meningoseptica]|uniref:type VI secretion system TssO n=1 Tax=Elizabethkingia meningoseptica TaxID=238 RepID=UPI000999859C|nr:type VI secretion system TssO [Elizabethkingia meningoseptica]OPC00077.1 hypothetical protein BAS10_02620 [Elizabethkingia meningoseptica]
MISSGQEKLNRKDVSKGIWKFIFSFAILSGVSFLSVFLFFKSSEYQKDNIQKEVENYKNILNKNELLQSRMESILNKMGMMANGKVQSENFLRDNIVEDIHDCKNIMGKDSIKEFKQYASLLRNIKEMVSLKDRLISASLEEQVALRNLQECQGRLNVVTSNLMNSAPKVKPMPRKR